MTEFDQTFLKQIRPELTPDTPNCVDSDLLTAYVNHQLDASKSAAVTSHLSQCAACASLAQFAFDAREWSQQLSQSIALEAHKNNQQAKTKKTIWRPRIWIPAGFAVLVAVFFFTLAERAPLIDDVMRGEPELKIVPKNGARLSQSPNQINWDCAYQNGTLINSMQLELLDASASRVWLTTSASCSVQIPISLKKQMQSGTYFWRVLDAQNRVLHGPFEFHLQQ